MAVTLDAARKIWKREDKDFVDTIKKILAVSTLDQESLGKKLGMTSKTLRSRMKAPSTFTRGEEQTIRYLAEVYGV